MTLRLPRVDIEPMPIDWQGLPKRFINPDEIETMVALLRPIAPARMAEFGVNTGRTARLLLDNLPSLDEYFGFDVPSSYVPRLPVQHEETWRDQGKYAQHDPRFSMSITARGTFDITDRELGILDAVFIDGDHSREGVENDSQLAYAVVRPGGIVIWHDYHDIGSVDVADVLHDLLDLGHDIKHVNGTWLAFEVIR